MDNVKRYLRNLWLALTGADPFADEVAVLRGRLEKAAENVRSLNEMYYSAVEKWDEAQHLLFESGRMVGERNSLLAERDKQIASLQTLVENLRQRIREKDAELSEQSRMYRERINELTKNAKQ